MDRLDSLVHLELPDLQVVEVLGPLVLLVFKELPVGQVRRESLALLDRPERLRLVDRAVSATLTNALTTTDCVLNIVSTPMTATIVRAGRDISWRRRLTTAHILLLANPFVVTSFFSWTVQTQSV